MPKTDALSNATNILDTIKQQVIELERLIQEAQAMPVYRDAGRKEALAQLDIAKQACLLGSTAASIEKIMSESAHNGFFKIADKS